MSDSSQYTLEYIRWEDHCKAASMEESPLSDIADATPALWETVGWVVKEKPTYLVVANNLVDANDAIGWLVILKSTIIQRKVL